MIPVVVVVVVVVVSFITVIHYSSLVVMKRQDTAVSSPLDHDVIAYFRPVYRVTQKLLLIS